MRDDTGQRGSVLMLMPAAILVLVILGSIAVDSALAFLGQRELNNFTTEVADDAASAAIDQPTFYATGQLRIDPARTQVIAAGLETHLGSGVRNVRVSLSFNGASVTVTAVGDVDDLFARAIPGVRHEWRVQASSTSTARRLQGP